MARFNSLLALFGGLLAVANASPAATASDILTPAQIINALGVGLVKDINAFITVQSHPLLNELLYRLNLSLARLSDHQCHFVSPVDISSSEMT